MIKQWEGKSQVCLEQDILALVRFWFMGHGVPAIGAFSFHFIDLGHVQLICLASSVPYIISLGIMADVDSLDWAWQGADSITINCAIKPVLHLFIYNVSICIIMVI